jgi:hypothetical protein
MSGTGDPQPALDRSNPRLAWALDHPVKFAAVAGAIGTSLILISMGLWAINHPVQAVVRVPLVWLSLSFLFWLVTKAKK